MEEGPKERLRPGSFADHYSQARQFCVSQSPNEQKLIGDALTFEPSKFERRTFARAWFRTSSVSTQAWPRPTRDDLPVSDALSILKHDPQVFAGRKLGVFLTDGADAGLFDFLNKAATEAGAVVEVVAPKVAGAILFDGTLVPAKRKIDGGPSVLFDVVAVLTSSEGAALLAQDSAAKDFVTDAFADCKFIGYCTEAQPSSTRPA